MRALNFFSKIIAVREEEFEVFERRKIFMDRPPENRLTVQSPIVGGPFPYLFFRLAFSVELPNLPKRKKPRISPRPRCQGIFSLVSPGIRWGNSQEPV